MSQNSIFLGSLRNINFKKPAQAKATSWRKFKS